MAKKRRKSSKAGISAELTPGNNSGDVAKNFESDRLNFQVTGNSGSLNSTLSKNQRKKLRKINALQTFTSDTADYPVNIAQSHMGDLDLPFKRYLGDSNNSDVHKISNAPVCNNSVQGDSLYKRFISYFKGFKSQNAVTKEGNLHTQSTALPSTLSKNQWRKLQKARSHASVALHSPYNTALMRGDHSGQFQESQRKRGKSGVPISTAQDNSNKHDSFVRSSSKESFHGSEHFPLLIVHCKSENPLVANRVVEKTDPYVNEKVHGSGYVNSSISDQNYRNSQKTTKRSKWRKGQRKRQRKVKILNSNDTNEQVEIPGNEVQGFRNEHDFPLNAALDCNNEYDFPVNVGQDLNYEHDIPVNASQNFNNEYDFRQNVAQDFPVTVNSAQGFNIGHNFLDRGNCEEYSHSEIFNKNFNIENPVISAESSDFTRNDFSNMLGFEKLPVNRMISEPYRGKALSQVGDDRRSRRGHPYSRPNSSTGRGPSNRYSTFDLAYKDLNELMQCLTSRTFKMNKKKRRNLSTATMPVPGKRFSNYKFVRAAGPEEEEKEIEPEDLICKEDIKDFEVRRQMADLVEELAEKSLSDLMAATAEDEEFIVLDETNDEDTEDIPINIIPVCSSTPGRQKQVNCETSTAASNTSTATQENKLHPRCLSFGGDHKDNCGTAADRLQGKEDINSRHSRVTNGPTDKKQWQSPALDCSVQRGGDADKLKENGGSTDVSNGGDKLRNPNKEQEKLKSEPTPPSRPGGGGQNSHSVKLKKSVAWGSLAVLNSEHDQPTSSPHSGHSLIKDQDVSVIVIEDSDTESTIQCKKSDTECIFDTEATEDCAADSKEPLKPLGLVQDGVPPETHPRSNQSCESPSQAAQTVSVEPSIRKIETLISTPARHTQLKAGHWQSIRDMEERQESAQQQSVLSSPLLQYQQTQGADQVHSSEQQADVMPVGDWEMANKQNQDRLRHLAQLCSVQMVEATHDLSRPHQSQPNLPQSVLCSVQPHISQPASESFQLLGLQIESSHCHMSRPQLTQAEAWPSYAPRTSIPQQSQTYPLSHFGQTYAQFHSSQTYFQSQQSHTYTRPNSPEPHSHTPVLHNHQSHISQCHHPPQDHTSDCHTLNTSGDHKPIFNKSTPNKSTTQSFNEALHHHTLQPFTTQQNTSQIQGESKVDDRQVPDTLFSQTSPLVSASPSGLDRGDTYSLTKFLREMGPAPLSCEGSSVSLKRKSSEFDINPRSTFLPNPAQYKNDLSLVDMSLSQEEESSSGNQITEPNASSISKLNALLSSYLTQASSSSSQNRREDDENDTAKSSYLPQISSSLPQGQKLPSDPASQPSPLHEKTQCQSDIPPPVPPQSHQVGTKVSVAQSKDQNRSVSPKATGRKLEDETRDTGGASSAFSPPPPPPPPLPQPKNASADHKILGKKVKRSRTRTVGPHPLRHDIWENKPPKITFMEHQRVYMPNPDLKEKRFYLLEVSTQPSRDPRLNGRSKRERQKGRRTCPQSGASVCTIRVVKDIPLEPVENLKKIAGANDQPEFSSLEDQEKAKCEDKLVDRNETSNNDDDQGKDQSMQNKQQTRKEREASCVSSCSNQPSEPSLSGKSVKGMAELTVDMERNLHDQLEDVQAQEENGAQTLSASAAIGDGYCRESNNKPSDEVDASCEEINPAIPEIDSQLEKFQQKDAESEGRTPKLKSISQHSESNEISYPEESFTESLHTKSPVGSLEGESFPENSNENAHVENHSEELSFEKERDVKNLCKDSCMEGSFEIISAEEEDEVNVQQTKPSSGEPPKLQQMLQTHLPGVEKLELMNLGAAKSEEFVMDTRCDEASVIQSFDAGSVSQSNTDSETKAGSDRSDLVNGHIVCWSQRAVTFPCSFVDDCGGSAAITAGFSSEMKCSQVDRVTLNSSTKDVQDSLAYDRMRQGIEKMQGNASLYKMSVSALGSQSESTDCQDEVECSCDSDTVRELCVSPHQADDKKTFIRESESKKCKDQEILLPTDQDAALEKLSTEALACMDVVETYLSDGEILSSVCSLNSTPQSSPVHNPNDEKEKDGRSMPSSTNIPLTVHASSSETSTECPSKKRKVKLKDSSPFYSNYKAQTLCSQEAKPASSSILHQLKRSLLFQKLGPSPSAEKGTGRCKSPPPVLSMVASLKEETRTVSRKPQPRMKSIVVSVHNTPEEYTREDPLAVKVSNEFFKESPESHARNAFCNSPSSQSGERQKGTGKYVLESNRKWGYPMERLCKEKEKGKETASYDNVSPYETRDSLPRQFSDGDYKQDRYERGDPTHQMSRYSYRNRKTSRSPKDHESFKSSEELESFRSSKERESSRSSKECRKSRSPRGFKRSRSSRSFSRSRSPRAPKRPMPTRHHRNSKSRKHHKNRRSDSPRTHSARDRKSRSLSPHSRSRSQKTPEINGRSDSQQRSSRDQFSRSSRYVYYCDEGQYRSTAPNLLSADKTYRTSNTTTVSYKESQRNCLQSSNTRSRKSPFDQDLPRSPHYPSRVVQLINSNESYQLSGKNKVQTRRLGSSSLDTGPKPLSVSENVYCETQSRQMIHEYPEDKSAASYSDLSYQSKVVSLTSVSRNEEKQEINKHVPQKTAQNAVLKASSVHNERSETKNESLEKSLSVDLRLQVETKQKDPAAKVSQQLSNPVKSFASTLEELPSSSTNVQDGNSGVITVTTESLLSYKLLTAVLSKIDGKNKDGMTWRMEVHIKSICELDDKRKSCVANSLEFQEVERCLALINRHQLSGAVRLVQTCECRSRRNWGLPALIKCLVSRSKPEDQRILLAGVIDSSERDLLEVLYPEVMVTSMDNILSLFQ